MAELALAIAPLCISAISGIKLVNRKLKILRHHDKEIKRLKKKFTTQTDIFLDEIQLLLQDFLDPKEAETLIEDSHHPRWKSPQLNEDIRNYMGRKFEAFSKAVEEVQSNVDALGDGLESKGTNENRSGKMKEAVDVMINKSKYESLIEGLKESNQDIKRLRKTAGKIQRCQTKVRLKRSRPLPVLYQEIMQNSKSFHIALRHFWSCFQTQHVGHDVRLLLDSREDGSLHVVVQCHTRNGLQVQDALVDLLIRSQNLRFLHISMDATCQTSEPAWQRKKRRVMFADNSISTSMAIATSVETTTASTVKGSTPWQDLCSTSDLCSHLCHHSNASACRGYLDTPDHWRHHVYPACNSECDHKRCLGGKPSKTTSLEQIFQLPVERTISVPEQVRLALRLVKGVLQFHSTPWLQPYWKLQDLSYFQAEEGLAASLNTLHISTELSRQQEQQQRLQKQDTVILEQNNETKVAQLSYGIRNLTMHSLGVALLQIGQWNPVNPDDVVTVRKIADLAEHDSRLGPRYQKITQQCLDCDFGFGKDLSQPELQSAIYKDVVCELEGLISILEGRITTIS